MEGQIGLLGIIVNKNDSSVTNSYNYPKIISEHGYTYYGKFFTMHTSSTTSKLYISSERNDTLPKVHNIEEAAMCTHTQRFNSSSKECYSISDRYYTYGVQNTTSERCTQYMPYRYLDRIVGETF